MFDLFWKETNVQTINSRPTVLTFQSTVCKKIMEKLGQDSVDQHQRQVVCISQDSFYRELNEEDKNRAFKGQFNFDHPGDYFIYLLVY